MSIPYLALFLQAPLRRFLILLTKSNTCISFISYTPPLGLSDHDRCFRKRAPLFIVLVSFLLLEACVAAGAASSVSTSSSSLWKHGDKVAAVRIRKLLTINTAEKLTTAEAEAAPSECSEDAVEVSQSQGQDQPQHGAGVPPPGQCGVGTYSVTIANTCLQCTVRDVHIACGEFGLAQLVVAPADFRRVADGDCLVRGGDALGPGESVSFSLFQYQFHVASVSCS